MRRHNPQLRPDAFGFVDIPSPPAWQIRRAERRRRRKETIAMLLCLTGALTLGIIFGLSI